MASNTRDSERSLLSDALEHMADTLKQSLMHLTQSLTQSLAGVREAVRQEALKSEQHRQEALHNTEERFLGALRESEQRTMARYAEVAATGEWMQALVYSNWQNRVGEQDHNGLEKQVTEMENAQEKLKLLQLLEESHNGSSALLSATGPSTASTSTSSGSSSALLTAAGLNSQPLYLSSNSSSLTRSGASASVAFAPATLTAFEFCQRKALFEAAKLGKVEIVRALLDEGVDVNIRDAVALTPLHCAASRSQTEVVRLLLEKGADVTAVDVVGFTALHFAAAQDATGHCVGLLIAAGADVNLQDREGDTPLHWAASKGRFEAARLLIGAGASKTVTNTDKHIPHDLASAALREFLRP